MSSAVAVISPQYCVNSTTEFSTIRSMHLKYTLFGISDANGDVVFKIRDEKSFHDRRVLLDAAGNTIITFQQKIRTAHRRWQAFRGESTDPKDLIFTVKKSMIMQFKSKLNVFMAANVEEECCDFKIKGNLWETSCVIYAGDTTNIIAKMHKEASAEAIMFEKDKTVITVYPNVDQAFIVALVIILEEINKHGI